MFKRVVFISLPMNGLSDEITKANIQRAKDAYLAITKLDITQVAFIDNFGCISPFDPEVSKNSNRIWCLGNALKRLASCDEAFFWLGWQNSTGCIIEHNVCFYYDIPVITVEKENYYG